MEVHQPEDIQTTCPLSKYFQACDREGIQFFPVVVEALGGWHEGAAALVTRLARQLASHTGKEVDLFKRLVILLMRGNSAALILNRIPTQANAEVDGMIRTLISKAVENLFLLCLKLPPPNPYGISPSLTDPPSIPNRSSIHPQQNLLPSPTEPPPVFPNLPPNSILLPP